MKKHRKVLSTKLNQIRDKDIIKVSDIMGYLNHNGDYDIVSAEIVHMPNAKTPSIKEPHLVLIMERPIKEDTTYQVRCKVTGMYLHKLTKHTPYRDPATFYLWQGTEGKGLSKEDIEELEEENPNFSEAVDIEENEE